MGGGRKSLLVNSANICAGTHRAAVNFNAHNGKLANYRTPLKASCGHHKNTDGAPSAPLTPGHHAGPASPGRRHEAK